MAEAMADYVNARIITASWDWARARRRAAL